MNRKVIVRSDAERDIAEALRYYDDQRSGLGDKFLAEYEQFLSRICANPEHFTPVRNSRGKEVRKVRMERFISYTIFFECYPDTIKVCLVWHGARNSDELKRRLK